MYLLNLMDHSLDMKLNNCFRIVIFLFSLTSCSYRIEKDKNSLDSIVVSNQRLETISFQEVKAKVFLPKCISCHGNSGGVSLENYDSARSHMNQITETVINNKTMPKSGSVPLTEEEYLIVAAWLKAGAPNAPNNGSTIPPMPVEVLKPEFNSIKKIIIDRKCINCHRVGGEAPRVILDTPKDMIDSPLDIVLPGNADESDLIMTLEHEGSTKPMPPLDSGISPVSKEDIEVVKEWINKGAKD